MNRNHPDDPVPEALTKVRLSRRQLALSSAWALLSGGVLLAGCKGAETTSENGATGRTGGAPAKGPAPASSGALKTVTYAIVPKMLNNPFFDIAHNGALKAKRDL